MPQTFDVTRRGARAAFAALALMTAVACSDDEPTEVEAEPEVAAVIVTAGASSASVPHPSGAQTGTLMLQRLQPNTVTFRFTGSNGQDEAVIAAGRDEFELRGGSPMPTSVVFVPGTGGTGATFTATITPSVAGQVTIPFQLFNTHHGHAELVKAVVVTVAP